jgi:hypothetical protein
MAEDDKFSGVGGEVHRNAAGEVIRIGRRTLNIYAEGEDTGNPKKKSKTGTGIEHTETESHPWLVAARNEITRLDQETETYFQEAGRIRNWISDVQAGRARSRRTLESGRVEDLEKVQKVIEERAVNPGKLNDLRMRIAHNVVNSNLSDPSDLIDMAMNKDIPCCRDKVQCPPAEDFIDDGDTISDPDAPHPTFTMWPDSDDSDFEYTMIHQSEEEEERRNDNYKVEGQLALCHCAFNE